MKILVCIKQVPDMEAKFKIDSDGLWYDNADLAWRMNEYDEYAVEQAVQLKAQVGEADLTILSIGPDRVKEAIKKGLAMGGDRGVQVVDNDYYKKDCVEIASIIAEFASGKDFDLIFTGMQSQDRGSAQVGILVGEMLQIPAVSTIVDFVYDNGTVRVKRELEGGMKAQVDLSTPALLTCQLGLNTPRYPTLPNIMKAKKKELLTIEVAGLLKASPVISVEKTFYPEKKSGGRVIEGDIAELVEQTVKVLKEEAKIL